MPHPSVALEDDEAAEGGGVQRIHVYPQFGPEHTVEGHQPCWCHPSDQRYCNAVFVIHNVMH